MSDWARRWNHNIHYHRLVLDAVPAGARTALDVGTGNGLLAADLHRLIREVTGIDLDRSVLDDARREDPSVHWLHGDVLDQRLLPAASFDVVTSVATMHHFPDLEQALHRFAELTAPGGVVALVGVARSSRPGDALYDAAGVVQHQWYSRRYGVWEHSAPTLWPPRHTYAEVRATAARMLPGMRWTRLPLWRYAVTWTKPHT
ncbi:SAM-dependent methyltransferase [Rhodococcus sp. 06-621-2]|nr:class I SAM-dependent methyltransferase [Rhodococcus sp. 06-621-2]OZC56592.1 SAM-dependent methyltransferase [Rhodococcus sp. 06-621-2]